MPVGERADHFSRQRGAPTKELDSMTGLVFVTDFSGWTAQEAAEAYIFRSDVPYALNWEPDVAVSARSVDRYQKLVREDELAAQVFHDVTIRLAEKLELNISRQRLDSTHVFSHRASLGRTKLMAVAIKRFLPQVQRNAPEQYATLPEGFRRRSEPADSQLFADAEPRHRSRQKAAEDLLCVIEQFAGTPEITGRSSYKALVTIFHQQCEVSDTRVVVKTKTGGDCVQNPSDVDATYDAHKGQGYQVQIAETCSPQNEVQNLAFRCSTGAEIEDNRRLLRFSGHRHAKGIGAKAGRDAPGRGHALTGTSAVDGCNQNDPGVCCPLGVFAEPADVPAIPDRSGGETGGLGLRQDPTEQPMCLDLAEPPLPIAHEQNWCLALDHQGDSNPVLAPLQEGDILRSTEHAVRVVSSQVGADKASGDEPCIIVRHAGRGEQPGGKLGQGRRDHGRHTTPPT